jgi:hypothetical protein
MARLSAKTAARFTTIAQELIERQRFGSSGFRRSLGAHTTFTDAEVTGKAFLRYVKRNFPGYNFGVSGIEGTGGTHNLRVRAYCKGPHSAKSRVRVSH